MKRNAGMYMTSPVITIDVDFSLEEILRTFKEEKVSHLIVLKNTKYEGVISKSDVLDTILKISKIASGKTYTDLSYKNILASDIMTANAIQIRKTDSVDFATELLLQGEFHCLPVVSDGNLEGILTPYDLLQGYYHEAG